jgi:hypothetical protein
VSYKIPILAQRTMLLLVIAGVTSTVSLSYFVFDDASGNDAELTSSLAQSETTRHPTTEQINLILQSVNESTENESEKIFSSLEQLLLSYDKIDPQTLSSIIKKTDFNNQIDQSTLDGILSELKENQEIDSSILVKSLNGLIYNDSMFNGSELNLEAVTITLFSKFEKTKQNERSEQEQFGLPYSIISA